MRSRFAVAGLLCGLFLCTLVGCSERGPAMVTLYMDAGVRASYLTGWTHTGTTRAQEFTPPAGEMPESRKPRVAYRVNVLDAGVVSADEMKRMCPPSTPQGGGITSVMAGLEPKRVKVGGHEAFRIDFDTGKARGFGVLAGTEQQRVFVIAYSILAGQEKYGPIFERMLAGMEFAEAGVT